MQVGQAEILVKLQDASLNRELTAAERKVLATMKKISAMRAEAEINADLKKFDAKIASAQAQIEAWKAERAEATLDADITAAEEGLAEARALAAQWEGKKFTARLELETRRDMEERLQGMVNRFGRVKQSADEAETAIGRWARQLSNMTLRIGPFSASLRQFGLAVGLLGPIINSVVGSLGALLAVTASGIAGGLVLAGAGFTGAAMAGMGLLFVLKPLIQDYKDASTAARAYDNAVNHYGKNSEQAAKKLEQYNQTLKGTNAVTRTAFLEAGKLSGAWSKLTESARAQGLNLIAEGIKTASDLMPGFAARTNQVAKLMSEGLTGWMRGLRGGEGRGILDTIFGQFNRALPPLLRSLGNVGTFLGRTFAIAAESLRPATLALERWTQSLANAAKTSGFRASIKTMIGDAGRLVKLLGGAGDLFLAFTGAGRKTGAPMLDAITKQLRDWAKEIRAGALDQFFADAQNMIGKVVDGVGSLISALYNLSRVLTPIVSAMLSAFDVVAKVVAAILGLRAVQQVTPYIAALAAAFLLARKALLSFGLTLQALSIARGVAVSLGLMAPAAAAAATGATAATAATGSLGAALAGLPVLPILGGLALLAGGAVLLANNINRVSPATERLQQSLRDTDATIKSLQGMTASYGGVVANAARSLRDLGDSSSDAASAKQRLIQLDQAGKRGTAEWNQALQEFNQELDRRKTAQDQVQKAMAKEAAAGGILIAGQMRRLGADQAVADVQERLAEAQKRYRDAEKSGTGEITDFKADVLELENQLNEALSRRRRLNAELTAAMNVQAAGAANQQRALQGMQLLTDKAEQSLGRLARAGKAGQQIAMKVAVKYPDPADVQRVAQQARGALSAGVGKGTVLKIIADSSSAEQAIARLQAKRLDPKLLEIVEKGGDRAIRKLEQIAGRKLTPRELRIVQDGGEDALALLGELAGVKLNPKRIQILGAETAWAGVVAVNALKGAIDALQSKTVTVTAKTIGKIGWATGRGPMPDKQTALVGEGAGPEWVVNPKSGKAARVDSPRFMRLDPNDYVIPTEGRYRDRARMLMQMLASDMGIEQLDAGRASAARKKKKTSRKKKRWIPREHRFDADPDDLKSAYESAKNRYEKLKDDKKASAKKKAEAKSKMNRARKVYVEARNYDRRIEKVKSDVEEQRNLMTLADQADNQTGYDKARGSRANLLRRLIGLYKLAYKQAPTGPWKRELRGKLRDAQISLGENATETMDPAPEMSLEEWLDQFGKGGTNVLTGLGRLRVLERDFALAKADQRDTEDDKARAQDLVSFWENILGVAQSDKSTPVGIVTQIADSLVAARETLKGIQGGTSTDSPDVQAQFDQYKARFNAASMGRFVDASVARIFGDTSPALNPSGGATQVVFQSYVPPSPAEALRLADYTVGGMSYQGTSSASTEYLNA